MGRDLSNTSFYRSFLPVLQPVELLTRDIHTGRDLSNTFFCRFCGECGVGTPQTRGWVTIRRNPLKIRKVGGRAGRRFLARLASPRIRRSPPPMPAGSVRPVRAVRLLPCSASGSRNQEKRDASQHPRPVCIVVVAGGGFEPPIFGL